MTKATIVIHIPEQELCETIVSHLSKLDYQLHLASDTSDALQLIEAYQPDIAILWNKQIIHPGQIETLDEGNLAIHHYCNEQIIGKIWVAPELETGIFDLSWMSDLDDVHKYPYYVELLDLQLKSLLEAVKTWRTWHEEMESYS